MFKRVTAFIICAVLMFSSAFMVSAAAEKREWSPSLSVGDIEATANDTVLVNIELNDNKYGIMAFTLSLMYDKSALTYVGYHKGNFRDSWMYVVEKDGYIAMVDCEKTNIFDNGTMITLEFTVNKDVHGGEYPLTIAHVRPKTNGQNLKDCLANKRGDIITPNVTNGKLIIPVTQENCRHDFDKWEEKVEATCTEDGIKVRNCKDCGKSETKTVKKTGVHIYNEEWTVDEAATKEKDGVMSRHCKNCSEKTDYIYFPYKSAEDSLKEPEKESDKETDKDTGFNNEVGDMVEESDKIVVDNYKPEDSKSDTSSKNETSSKTDSSSKKETSSKKDNSSKQESSKQNSSKAEASSKTDSSSKEEKSSKKETSSKKDNSSKQESSKQNSSKVESSESETGGESVAEDKNAEASTPIVKKEGIVSKIISFFYDSDGESGIINIVINAVKKFIENLFK